MLHTTEELRSLTLRAGDGEIGSVHDIYFDDARWTIRYLVVDIGGWLPGRKVLISPQAVKRLDFGRGELDVQLTREQIRQSPQWDADKPISRQYEAEYAAHYGYPSYWAAPPMWGAADFAGTPAADAAMAQAQQKMKEEAQRERAHSDPHLRSAREVTGYSIEASDGAIGHLEALLLDESSWTIAALIVDTRNWLPGKHVIITPDLVREFDWSSGSVLVRAARARIETSAEYNPHAPTERERRVEQIRHALRLGE